MLMLTTLLWPFEWFNYFWDNLKDFPRFLLFLIFFIGPMVLLQHYDHEGLMYGFMVCIIFTRTVPSSVRDVVDSLRVLKKHTDQ